MAKDLFYFDFVESLVIDIAHQDYKYLLAEVGLPIKAKPKTDPLDVEDLLRRVRENIYKYIQHSDSIAMHRFFAFSDSQALNYTPSRRIKQIQNAFWESCWAPEKPQKPISISESNFINAYIQHYKNEYQEFIELYSGFKNDYKAGLLGSQTSQAKVVETNTPKIKNESLSIFLKQLTYNYPYKISVHSFKYSMLENLDYLKQEILDNLITLSKDDRKPYLNKLKYNIGNNRQHSTINKDEINIWLKKYNIASEEDIRFTKEGNVLYQILESEPPTMDEEFEENFNRDTHDIQFEFYNYYYGFYIDEAVKFIDEQINEHSPNPITTSLNNQEKQEQKALQPKLKTNLTVSELSFLFKMLNELKPEIFNTESDAELFRFISANFETKRSTEEGISTQKLRNLFSNPDLKAVNFWQKHFSTLNTEIKKYK